MPTWSSWKAARISANWRWATTSANATRERQTDPQTGPGGILGDLLVKKCGWKPGKKLQLRIRIAAEVGDRVIAFAYRQETPEARQAVLKELKEMLTGYLLP